MPWPLVRELWGSVCIIIHNCLAKNVSLLHRPKHEHPFSAQIEASGKESVRIVFSAAQHFCCTNEGGRRNGDYRSKDFREDSELGGGHFFCGLGGGVVVAGEVEESVDDIEGEFGGCGVVELRGAGANTSIDSPDTNASIGAPGDTVSMISAC